MMARLFKTLLFFFAFFLWLSPNANAQYDVAHQHTLVTMRLIGHQILMHSGDSLSRILPIKEEEGRFKISFENDFSINPDDLVSIVSNTIEEKRIARHYLVELEQSETQEVVYNYEIGNTDTSTVVSCNSRTLPSDNYSLYITIFTPYNTSAISPLVVANSKTIQTPETNEASNWPLFVILFLMVLFSASYFYFKKRNTEPVLDPDIIAIGNYRFNKQNMELSFHDMKTELTGKEADLLNLLYASANNTVEHETILRAVWNDNGDYVGRTLDVFISKLRRKLDADENVKIINVRGVGYRLVLNQA